MSDTINLLHGPQVVDDAKVRTTHCASPKRFYIARGVDQPVIRTLPVTVRRAASDRSARESVPTSPSPNKAPARPSDEPVRAESRRKAPSVPRFVRAAVERATR
jgi:hypothetical protein